MISELLKIRKFHHTKLFHKLQYCLSYSGVEQNFKTMMHMIKANNIDGDYAEFGVYQGNSLITAATFAKIFDITKMHFYGFDSFQGLPQATGTDRELPNAEAGKYSVDYEKIKRQILRSGLSPNQLTLVKGFYAESLQQIHNKKKLAIAHIDCDFYESTIQVLNYIQPLLQVGTMLLFDDWYLFRGQQNRGQQKAFHEFRQNNPNLIFDEIAAYDLRKIFLVSQINNMDS